MDVKIEVDEEVATIITIEKLKQDLKWYKQITGDPHRIRLMTELAFAVVLEYYGHD